MEEWKKHFMNVVGAVEGRVVWKGGRKGRRDKAEEEVI